jgi:hypothetical protein
MNATTTTTIISGMITDISDTLVSVLPEVLGLVAVLMGLFFGVRQLRKYIGKSK